MHVHILARVENSAVTAIRLLYPSGDGSQTAVCQPVTAVRLLYAQR